MIRWLLALFVVLAAPLQAQQVQDRRPSHCIALAEMAPGIRVIPASYSQPVPAGGIRISYIDHSMFLIQTPGGLTAVTDFNGSLGATRIVPDVVTMNHAHSSHWTPNPDPRVPHILPGWNPDGGGRIDHWVDLGEMLIRNVSTDIRTGFGGSEPGGNSIFVFEVEGLCIGHLGHLHHMPTEAQFAALGRLDVVMAPVDGGMTLDLPRMIQVVERLRSSVIIPMHWFSMNGLQHFLAGMNDDFAIDLRDDSTLEVSLRSLPSRPTITVLRPRYLGYDE